MFGRANLFGQSTQQYTFGNLSNPDALNTSTPFGQHTAQPTFGDQHQQNADSNTLIFDQPSTLLLGENLFGRSTTTPPIFGQTQQINDCGTALAKYQSTYGSETFSKNGQNTNQTVRRICITAMKDYENKSIEMLRFEDYTANRKGSKDFNPIKEHRIFSRPLTLTTGGPGQPSTPSIFDSFGERPLPTLNGFNVKPFSLTQPSFSEPSTSSNSFVKYQPRYGQDIYVKFIRTEKKVMTKHNCITAMKEFENKSLDELRLGDYVMYQIKPIILTEPSSLFSDEASSAFTSSIEDETKASAQNGSETNPNSIILTFSKLEIRIPNGANSDPVSRSVQTTNIANDPLIQQLYPIIEKLSNQKK